ncbi:MAG: Mur ligase family protein, partial [Emergencia sp.]|nr:Mur ligase family protein [Emergencia sp.]
MRFYIALWFAKLINVIINIVDKSRGSNFSGEKAMKIDPKMVAHFKGIDCSKVLFITGTNGKSTTTNLVTHIFRSNGKKVIANLEGANLIYGIATALSKVSTLTGKIDADYI